MNQIIKIGNTDYFFLNIPNECPECQTIISPVFKSYFPIWDNYGKIAFVVFGCPHTDCGQFFLYKFFFEQNVERYQFIKQMRGNPVTKKFPPQITELSQNFCSIFNEAEIAEFNGLNQICGVGYRKALEFLIKDFCISRNADKEEEIKSSLLMKCIKTYITSDNIKLSASRATWLGNDETHYVRKWVDKDVTYLKKLIDLTLHWIEAELLTENLQTEMPD